MFIFYQNICLKLDFLEILFVTLERYVPLASRVWGSAMNQRINTTGLPLYEVYYQAYKKGINSKLLATIPE